MLSGSGRYAKSSGRMGPPPAKGVPKDRTRPPGAAGDEPGIGPGYRRPGFVGMVGGNPATETDADVYRRDGRRAGRTGPRAETDPEAAADRERPRPARVGRHQP